MERVLHRGDWLALVALVVVVAAVVLYLLRLLRRPPKPLTCTECGGPLEAGPAASDVGVCSACLGAPSSGQESK